MLKEWLRRQLSIEGAEKEHMVINDYWPEGKPFGFVADEWQEILAQIQPGDELCEYRSDEESWDELMGWEGVVLMRSGEMINSICTKMN